MHEFHFHSGGVTGSVLLAHPGMRDSNFIQSLVFVSVQDAEEGSMGVILNRPLGKRLKDLMPKQDLGGLAMAPVYWGGPVGTEHLLIMAFRWDLVMERWEWCHNLTTENVGELMADDEVMLRVFVGYAGWGKGQLEGELERKTWIVHKADATMLDVLDEGEDRWSEWVSQHGAGYRLLVADPENLGMN